MRQVWITRVGPPEVLELREAPDPVPKPGQVLIRVRASGVNFADIMARLGLYPDAPKLPAVIGYEVAGDIAAMGGEHWKKGYRCLAPTGRLVMFGLSSAATGKTRSVLSLLKTLINTPLFSFPPPRLINDNKALIGVNLGHMWGETELLTSWLLQLLAWYREGKIRPTVGARFPLAEAAAAHHYIQDRKNIGKVVLVP